MASPTSFEGCPPGLEPLSALDNYCATGLAKFFADFQKVEAFEVVTDWQTNNKYALLNERGEQAWLHSGVFSGLLRIRREWLLYEDLLQVETRLHHSRCGQLQSGKILPYNISRR